MQQEGVAQMVVPAQIVILLSGIPATGKSEFARYLAREHGFAHYDLERPYNWPRPDLHCTWGTDRSAFVAQVRKHHRRVVLDWGFPVSYLSWVEQLQDQDVRLFWFDGDVDRARVVFVDRGGSDVKCFDKQVKEIQHAAYPSSLKCSVIPALSSAGVFLDQRKIESMVFR
jgi:hypothetical protein